MVQTWRSWRLPALDLGVILRGPFVHTNRRTLAEPRANSRHDILNYLFSRLSAEEVGQRELLNSC